MVLQVTIALCVVLYCCIHCSIAVASSPCVLLSSREGKVLPVDPVDRDPLVMLDPPQLMARKAPLVRTM